MEHAKNRVVSILRNEVRTLFYTMAASDPKRVLDLMEGQLKATVTSIQNGAEEVYAAFDRDCAKSILRACKEVMPVIDALKDNAGACGQVQRALRSKVLKKRIELVEHAVRSMIYKDCKQACVDVLHHARIIPGTYTRFIKTFYTGRANEYGMNVISSNGDLFWEDTFVPLPDSTEQPTLLLDSDIDIDTDIDADIDIDIDIDIDMEDNDNPLSILDIADEDFDEELLIADIAA